jgi:hypothetical protein
LSGHKTTKDLWRALVADGTFKVSYNAAVTYHLDVPPPVAYLVRVAEVTGVRLEWLATGQEPIFEPVPAEGSGGSVDARLEAAFRAWVPEYDMLSDGLRRILGFVWSALVDSLPDGWEVLGLDREGFAAHGIEGVDWDAVGILAAEVARGLPGGTVADTGAPLDWWDYRRRYLLAAAVYVNNLPGPGAGRTADTVLSWLGYVTDAEEERIRREWPPYPAYDKDYSGGVEAYLRHKRTAHEHRDISFRSYRARSSLGGFAGGAVPPPPEEREQRGASPP